MPPERAAGWGGVAGEIGLVLVCACVFFVGEFFYGIARVLVALRRFFVRGFCGLTGRAFRRRGTGFARGISCGLNNHIGDRDSSRSFCGRRREPAIR